jgi:hypothetical protein
MSGCAHGVTPVQGSLFYPTRNFATLGMLLLRQRPMAAGEVRSFLPDSSCRHEDRTVPSQFNMAFVECAWRAVSEDPAFTVSC